ncbi:MAG: RluA family pseudouridine synthase [Verrucomicrobiota bacterium]
MIQIIHEDASLLVVHKPADLVCHPTKDGLYSSLISRVRIYLRSGMDGSRQPDLHRDAEASPHLIHRLDRETSGVVLIAKHAKVAGELGKIWETRAVHKEYLAIVHGHLALDRGTIDAPLGRDDASPVAIKDCVRPDGHPAQTEFAVEQRLYARVADDPAKAGQPHSAGRRREAPFSLLRLHPLTGRKHQIRIHLAHLGHPIVGDKIYGGDPDLYLALVEQRLTNEQRARLILPHHALHASRLQFDWRGQTRDFRADPEPAFAQFIAAGNAS